MKMLFIHLALMSMLIVPASASESKAEHKKFWLTDSYEFGRSGKDCRDILYDYGTQNFTVSSDEPDLLESLFNACKEGVKDKKTGKNSLPRLLHELNQ